MDVLRRLPRAARRTEARATLSMERVERVCPYYNSEGIQEELAAEGLLQQTRLGSATLRAIRTRPLVDATLAKLRSEPSRWLPKAFLELVADLEKYR